MEKIEEKLQKAGLTKNEANVYAELLRRGSINGSALAKKVKLDRTLTYQVLNSLAEKGLANYVVKENKKYFSPADPQNLMQEVEEREEYLKGLIPQLKKIEKIKEVKQEVEVYEGKAGLRVLFTELLKAKEVCFFGATGKSYDILRFEMPRKEKEIFGKGIKVRGVSDDTARKHKFTHLKNIKMRYLAGAKSFDSPTTILDDDKVIIHCLAQEPLVTIIKNKNIAKTYKNYFEALWKAAKP